MQILIEKKNGNFRAEFNDDGEVKDIIEVNNKDVFINMISHILEDRIDKEEVGIVLDPASVLKLLINGGMKPFTNDDWLAFQGCETKDPRIGHIGDFTIVLDGDHINVVHIKSDDCGTFFQLKLVGRG